MRQIRDMSIIEIDITNACTHKCSNCTRFCAHYKKPYFMDFYTFKRAVDSLQDFEGLISIIGGEPLLHPEFGRFAEYLQEVSQSKIITDGKSIAIVDDYLEYAKNQRWFETSYNKGKGYNLFTSIPKQFYKYYETIQDTFTHMFLNDHSNPSFHQPILISRKDLGINDEEFQQLKENCWLQNFWSASITPKGAFFCEVAGTLDMLLDGDGGKKIEKDWWKKDLSHFEDQFKYCEFCGMALKTFSRNANDSIDDASESLYQKLKELGSPAIEQGKVEIYNPNAKLEKDGISIGADMNTVTANYEPDYEKRMGEARKSLRPKRILGMFIVDKSNISQLNTIIETMKESLDELHIFIEEEMLECIDQNAIKSDKICLNRKTVCGAGEAINRMLKLSNEQDWIAFIKEDTILPVRFNEIVCDRSLNPGFLFLCHNGGSPLVLFSKIAIAFSKAGYDTIQRCKKIDEIVSLFGNKVCILKQNFEKQLDLGSAYFRELIYKEYDKDVKFKHKLKQVLINSGVKQKVLITNSAFIYHTLSIAKMIEELGYEVFVISSHKFKSYFEGWIEQEKVSYFKEEAFEFVTHKDFIDEQMKELGIEGAIVPFFPGASTAKPIDNYTDVFRTAQYAAGEIIGVVNIRREFVEIEYEY